MLLGLEECEPVLGIHTGPELLSVGEVQIKECTWRYKSDGGQQIREPSARKHAWNAIHTHALCYRRRGGNCLSNRLDAE